MRRAQRAGREDLPLRAGGRGAPGGRHARAQDDPRRRVERDAVLGQGARPGRGPRRHPGARHGCRAGDSPARCGPPRRPPDRDRRPRQQARLVVPQGGRARARRGARRDGQAPAHPGRWERGSGRRGRRPRRPSPRPQRPRWWGREGRRARRGRRPERSRHVGRGRRCRGAARGSRGRPALHDRRDPRRHGRTQPPVAHGPTVLGRSTRDQQRRRRHELHPVRAQPAAARVRPGQAAGPGRHRATRQGSGKDRHARRGRAHAHGRDDGDLRRRAAHHHRGRDGERRVRGVRGHARSRARVRLLPADAHPPHAPRPRAVERVELPLRAGDRPARHAGRVAPRRRADHRRGGRGAARAAPRPVAATGAGEDDLPSPRGRVAAARDRGRARRDRETAVVGGVLRGAEG